MKILSHWENGHPVYKYECKDCKRRCHKDEIKNYGGRIMVGMIPVPMPDLHLCNECYQKRIQERTDNDRMEEAKKLLNLDSQIISQDNQNDQEGYPNDQDSETQV